MKAKDIPEGRYAVDEEGFLWRNWNGFLEYRDIISKYEHAEFEWRQTWESDSCLAEIDVWLLSEEFRFVETCHEGT